MFSGEMTLDWWALVVSLGIVQGFVLTVALLMNRKGNRIANRFLAFLILIFVWIHLEYLSLYTEFYYSFPYFFGAYNGAWLLFGPLFYFYAVILTAPPFKLKFNHILHFLPAIVALLFFSELFQSAENKIASVIALHTVVSPGLKNLFFALQLLHMLVYILMIRNVLKQYSQKIKNEFSNLAKISLNWLRNLTTGLTIILCFSSMFYLVFFVGHVHTIFLDYIYTLPTTLLIYVIAFYTMFQPEIYRETINQPTPKKYAKALLKEEVAKEYLEKLLSYMKDERPYLDNDLKLTTLAEKLGMTVNNLSQVINEQCNSNFFDFVNKYRIDEAKRILSKPSDYEPTFLQIAFDVGFNNKVSFNNYFKKFTGITPSEFKKSLNFND